MPVLLRCSLASLKALLKIFISSRASFSETFCSVIFTSRLFSISKKFCTSFSVTKVRASPSSPLRAVLPTLWMQSLSFLGMLKLMTSSTDLMSNPLAARSVVTRISAFQFLKLSRCTILLVCFMMECSMHVLYPNFLRVRQMRWHSLHVLTKTMALDPLYCFSTASRYPFLSPEGMKRYLWMRVGTVVILSQVEYFLSCRCCWPRMDLRILPSNLLSMVAVSRMSCFRAFILPMIFSISQRRDWSNSLSAQSSTSTSQLPMYFWKVSLFQRSWATLPGVPTTTWGILSSSWFCFRQLVPPMSRACLRLMFWPKILNCSWICTASSLLGAMTIQNMPYGSLESLCSRGKANAAVLPLPVMALAMTLSPVSIGLKHSLCTSVGCLQPIFPQTFSSQLSSPMVLNSILIITISNIAIITLTHLINFIPHPPSTSHSLLISLTSLQLMSSNQRLQQLFISYGSYHHNLINKLIHIVCVPMILFSLFAMTQHINVCTLKGYDVPLSLVLYAGIMLYYLSVNVPIGVVCAAFYFVGWCVQKYLYDLPVEGFFKKALAVHVVSWVLQFVGHGVFEKRKPALFDNIAQVLSAPLFVVTEVLFMFSMKDMRTRVEDRISQNVKALKEKDLNSVKST